MSNKKLILLHERSRSKLVELVDPQGHLCFVDPKLAKAKLAQGWKPASEWVKPPDPQNP